MHLHLRGLLDVAATANLCCGAPFVDVRTAFVVMRRCLALPMDSADEAFFARVHGFCLSHSDVDEIAKDMQDYIAALPPELGHLQAPQ